VAAGVRSGDIETERDDLASACVRPQGRGVLEERRRGNDDALGATERDVQEWLVDQAVAPARPEHLAVVPDDQPMPGARQAVCKQRHRVRFVEHENVGLEARQQ